MLERAARTLPGSPRQMMRDRRAEQEREEMVEWEDLELSGGGS